MSLEATRAKLADELRAICDGVDAFNPDARLAVRSAFDAAEQAWKLVPAIIEALAPPHHPRNKPIKEGLVSEGQSKLEVHSGMLFVESNGRLRLENWHFEGGGEKPDNEPYEAWYIGLIIEFLEGKQKEAREQYGPVIEISLSRPLLPENPQ